MKNNITQTDNELYNKKAHVNELIFEITRQCNFSCDFCLRGEQENKEMEKETINNILSKIKSIKTITISGGEPTLVSPQLISYIVNRLKANNIPLTNFYMATNGSINPNHFFIQLQKLYEYIIYCDEKEGGMGYEIYNNIIDDSRFIVDISIGDYHNKYHNKRVKRMINKWKMFSFVNLRQDRTKNIIAEGTGTFIGTRYLKYNQPFEFKEDENTNEYELDMLYVNAYGDIYPNCDFSYDTQRHTVPNVNVNNIKNENKTILELANEYNEKLR